MDNFVCYLSKVMLETFRYKLKYTLVFLVIFVYTNNIYAQDFWLELNLSDSLHIRNLKTNSVGDLFIGTNHGIYYSSNNGEIIDYLSLNHSIIGLYVDNSDNIYAGSASIYHSSDNGIEWDTIVTPSLNVNRVFSDFDYLLFGFWGGIYKKIDFFDWQYALELDNTQLVTCFTKNDNGILYAGVTAFSGDSDGGVFRSLDNGDTWEQIGLAGFYIHSLVIDSQNNLYAGSIGNNGVGIYRSQDNGESWTPLKNDVFVSGIAITPSDHIYIACTNEHGTQGGVFCSTDYGESWEMLNTGLSNENVDGIHYSLDGYLYSYGYYLPVHRSNDPVYTVINSHTSNEKRLNVFPNPANDFLFIEFRSPLVSENQVYFQLVDLMGNVMLDKRLTTKTSFKINLQEMPLGIYILSIKTSKENYKQMILKI